MEIEFEKTYLAKSIPEGLENCNYKEIIDIYIPKSEHHPILRIRKNGDRFELTKKQPIDDADKSIQQENTIKLTEDEFNELHDSVQGKRTRKLRYNYPYKNVMAEVDVFLDDMQGLVVIDFEFNNKEDKDAFVMPAFCLVDVTQEEFIAGGMLCGKTFDDIKDNLDKFEYIALKLE